MDALCDSLFFKGNLNALIHRVLLSFLETYFSLIGYKEGASLSEDVLKQVLSERQHWEIYPLS